MQHRMRRHISQHLRRGLIGVTTIVLSGSLLVGCGSEGASDAETGTAGTTSATSAEADAAADWLAGQLDQGVVSGSFEETPGTGEWTTFADHGLSLDILFALQGRDDFADERKAVLDALEPQAAAYVGSGKDAYAGSHGKLVAALQAEERDPASYAGGELVTRLEGLVHTDEDTELGRAEDTWDPANKMGADYSNTIGQSWVVRALAGAESDLADEAVTFLLRQQCEDGYFRLAMESKDHTCDGGTAEESAASVDATGFAVLALHQAQEAGVEGVDGDVEKALADAAKWLTGAQAEDGSFADADVANANSTGVAAEALLGVGEDDAAEEAGRWLAEHQVAEDAEGGLADQAGAVAFDDAALAVGKENGLTEGTRPQWQRATAQAVPGLDALGSSES